MHIIVTSRGEKSRTLIVSNEFLSTLTSRYPGLEVVQLDLLRTNLPEILEDSVDAKFTLMSGGSPGEGAKTWEMISRYSKEFLSYDIYLITNPLWNFTVPYKLKHYIDVCSCRLAFCFVLMKPDLKVLLTIKKCIA